jgi:hypothetical protein
LIGGVAGAAGLSSPVVVGADPQAAAVADLAVAGPVPAPVAVPRVVTSAVPKPAAVPKRIVKAPRATAPRRTVEAAPVRVAPTPFTAADARRKGEAAFASLGVPLPAGWRFVVRRYDGTFLGLAETATKTVTVWVKRSDRQAALRITIAHELGHVLDYTRLTDADKQRYLALRNRSGSPLSRWYPANNTSDYASAAGDFSEVYALWLAGRGDFRSTFAPEPGSAAMARIAAFFQDLHAR